MTLLGPQLYWPKAAAFLLCLYAACYGLLMLYFVFIAIETLGAIVWFLGMLMLATTPFLALIHLSRATTSDSTAPARPLLMTIIMIAPTLFWGKANFDSLRPIALYGKMEFLLLGMPATLSFWLLVTFALLALRKTPTAT